MMAARQLRGIGWQAAGWLAPAMILHAGQFGDFTYEVVAGGVEITDFPTDRAGEVSIPASIDGEPVIRIGPRAFDSCAGLTGIGIPASVTTIAELAFKDCGGLAGVTGATGVTSIGDGAFQGCAGLATFTVPAGVIALGDFVFLGCAGLESIEVAAGNIAFVSLDGVLFGSLLTRLVAFPPGRGGGYDIPAGVTLVDGWAFTGCEQLTDVTIPRGVTGIGEHAFADCRGLTSLLIPQTVELIGSYGFNACSGVAEVIIPASVTAIGVQAFDDCSELASVSFAGDAPAMGGSVFDRTAPDLVIRFLVAAEGFSAPDWLGYRAEPINESDFPAAPWLLGHNLAHDTGLDQDLNGDGVELLLAYALNLDPHHNTRAGLPRPVLGPDRLSITYFSVSPGVDYSVQTSTDAVHWTTQGVINGSLQPGGFRTARVTLDAPSRYLRLVVEED